MKRQLFIVDGEFRTSGLRLDAFKFLTAPMLTRRATETEQAAYEFGRQEKAQEVLEALTREFFKESK